MIEREPPKSPIPRNVSFGTFQREFKIEDPLDFYKSGFEVTTFTVDSTFTSVSYLYMLDIPCDFILFYSPMSCSDEYRSPLQDPLMYM